MKSVEREAILSLSSPGRWKCRGEAQPRVSEQYPTKKQKNGRPQHGRGVGLRDRWPGCESWCGEAPEGGLLTLCKPQIPKLSHGGCDSCQLFPHSCNKLLCNVPGVGLDVGDTVTDGPSLLQSLLSGSSSRQ